MPAVTFTLYPTFREGNHEGAAINFVTPGGNGVKCAIVTGTYTQSDAHDYFDDITNQVTGDNYTAGGNVMSTGTVVLSAGTVTVDIGDPATWGVHATGFSTGRRAIIYHDTGTASTSRLIGYSADFGADKGNVDGDFTITVNASGLFTNT